MNDLSKIKPYEHCKAAIEHIQYILSEHDYFDSALLKLRVELLAKDFPELLSKYQKARKKAKRWKRKYLSEISTRTAWNSDDPKEYGRYIVCTKSGLVTTGFWSPVDNELGSAHWINDSSEYLFDAVIDPVVYWRRFPRI